MLMLNEIDQLENVYDLLALCCSYIFIETEKKVYDFQTFEDSKYDDVYDCIQEYIINKQDRGECDAFQELRKQIKSFLQPKPNIEKCFAIVQFIDELIEGELFDGFVRKKGIISYISLSHRYVDRVRIIPKYEESFVEKGELIYKEETKDKFKLFRKKHKCPCCNLDRTMSRYTICNKLLIDKYPFTIHRFAEKHPVSMHFKDRKQLIIAVFPVTNDKIDNILNVQFEKESFYIGGMYKDARERLQQRYRTIYEKCLDKDIDFLVFPEMLMNEEFMSQVDVKEGAPQIIIHGSIWESLCNKSIVTDGNMDEIFSYYKKEPFIHEVGDKEYTEHLDFSKNKEYNLLEILGLGRIGVGICKDLINEDVKMFHKYLDTNLLIIPAYTASNDLQSSARNLSEEFNCVVVVANSCSAIANNSQKNTVGFLTLPAKSNTQRTSLLKEYGKSECANKCVEECCGKIFSILFDQTERYEEIVSFKVVEDTL